MIKGFLFAIGAILAFAFVLFLLVLILKLTKKAIHAKVSVWKNYLEAIIQRGEYGEARFVSELIIGKGDDEEIKTPPGYKVEVDRQLVIDEEDTASKVRVKKTYKITKSKKDGKPK